MILDRWHDLGPVKKCDDSASEWTERSLGVSTRETRTAVNLACASEFIERCP